MTTTQDAVHKLIALQKRGNFNFELRQDKNHLIARFKKTANVLVMLLGLLMTGVAAYYIYQYYQLHQAMPKDIQYYAGLGLGIFIVIFTAGKRGRWLRLDLENKMLQHYSKSRLLSSEPFALIQNIRIVTARKGFFALSSGVELVTPSGNKLVGVFGNKEKAKQYAQLLQEILVGAQIQENEWVWLG